MVEFRVPLIIRGKVIEDADLEFGGRGGAAKFSSPDVGKHVGELALSNPSRMADLYRLTLEEVFDYLDALADRLSFGQNPYLQEAYELSCRTSGLGPDILQYYYRMMPKQMASEGMREIARHAVGTEYLEGWVETKLDSGITANIRAFGARTVHVVAGNTPSVSTLTIARNCLTRGDAIIKTPSNDPLTAAAVARTMIDMAPDHPLTRHISVGYWKGGDTTVEEALYQPKNIEKIVAWGGMASIKHISKYIQPGIELVTLDPKLSSTIIGEEAFVDEPTMLKVAAALARDVGGMNQEGCVNARVVYAQSGTDKKGIERLNRFGQMVWDAVQALPSHVSGPAQRVDEELQEEIQALRLNGEDWHKVIGSGGKAGAVIVSQMDEPVDFARILANRVVNLVPIDDMDTPVGAVNTYTQTIGIYPESLKVELRDRLALQGTQRLVTLGHCLGMGNHGIQDAIEPLRRMCRWIVEERAAPGTEDVRAPALAAE